MRIVCLGWGSLIWEPKELPIDGEWYKDGPLLPVEFTRISGDGRVTLIIDSEAEPVPVLWAKITVVDIGAARESLRVREGCPLDRIHWIDSLRAAENATDAAIQRWCAATGVDAAIWTGLSFSARTNHQRPTAEAIIAHLESLRGESAELAEMYVRRAPVQVATSYRAHIEKKLGWAPLAL
jgi:hypothetical protein